MSMALLSTGNCTVRQSHPGCGQEVGRRVAVIASGDLSTG